MDQEIVSDQLQEVCLLSCQYNERIPSEFDALRCISDRILGTIKAFVFLSMTGSVVMDSDYEVADNVFSNNALISENVLWQFVCLNEDSTESSCPICLSGPDMMTCPVSLPCGHILCGICLKTFSKMSENTQLSCPVCNSLIAGSISDVVFHKSLRDNDDFSPLLLHKRVGGGLQLTAKAEMFCCPDSLVISSTTKRIASQLTFCPEVTHHTIGVHIICSLLVHLQVSLSDGSVGLLELEIHANLVADVIVKYKLGTLSQSKKQLLLKNFSNECAGLAVLGSGTSGTPGVVSRDYVESSDSYRGVIIRFLKKLPHIDIYLSDLESSLLMPYAIHLHDLNEEKASVSLVYNLLESCLQVYPCMITQSYTSQIKQLQEHRTLTELEGRGIDTETALDFWTSEKEEIAVRLQNIVATTLRKQNRLKIISASYVYTDIKGFGDIPAFLDFGSNAPFIVEAIFRSLVDSLHLTGSEDLMTIVSNEIDTMIMNDMISLEQYLPAILHIEKADRTTSVAIGDVYSYESVTIGPSLKDSISFLGYLPAYSNIILVDCCTLRNPYVSKVSAGSISKWSRSRLKDRILLQNKTLEPKEEESDEYDYKKVQAFRMKNTVDSNLFDLFGSVAHMLNSVGDADKSTNPSSCVLDSEADFPSLV